MAAISALLAALASSGGVTLAKAAPASAFRATGGPDGYGYKFQDSQESGGPVYATEYENIGGTGTQLSVTNIDDGSASVSVPSGYVLRFYGQSFTSLTVMTNGNIQLGSTNTDYNNYNLPYSGVSGLIAPYWDDLHQGNPNIGGNVRWQMNGSGTSARLIVQWTNYRFYPGSSGDMTFQAKMYLSDAAATAPQDGRIVFNYVAMNGSTGSGATIGIQRPNASTALMYCFNGSPNQVANSRSIQFAANSDPNPPTNLDQSGTAGGPSLLLGGVSDATIYCHGTVTDPDAGNTVGLEIEVLPNSTPFSSNVTGQLASTPAGSMVPSGGVAECVYTFTGVPYSTGDYHWRARSRDSGGGSSPWVIFNGAAVNFTVDLTPPGAPSGPFSPNAVKLIGTNPTPTFTLTWGAATDIGPPGPMSYKVDVSGTNTFTQTLFTGISPTTDITAALPASDVDYFWRVAAIDQAGNQGPYSAAIPFQLGYIGNFPPPPDKYPYCGADAPANPWGLVALTGALALLAGALLRRRPAA